MKIKFDPNQTHQSLALESVYNVFEGQELNKTVFSMPTLQHSDTSMADLYSNQTEMGYANRIKLLPEEVLENVRQIQLKNGLKQSKGEMKSLDFRRPEIAANDGGSFQGIIRQYAFRLFHL